MKNIFKKPDTNLLNEWKSKLISLAAFILIFIYCEFLLHVSIYSSVDLRIIYPILFSLLSGAFFWILSSLFPEKVNRFISIAFISVIVIYYEVQLVYHCIFKSFMPFSQIFMGAEAVTNFFSQTLYAIGENIIPVLILFIPIPLSILLICKKKIRFKRIKLLQIPLSLVILTIFALLIWGILHLTDTSSNSAYAILTDPYSPTELCIKTNGLTATTIQEISAMISPVEAETDFNQTTLDDLNNYNKELNVTDTGIELLADPVSNYLASTSPTAKNKYTGIAKNYNLITICAEAFSPVVIDKELTPTLYKLSNEGLVFNNFYNSFPNTTTNGEYCMCTGLFPDMSRNKIENSFNEASDNYLPYCLGNIYSDMGYPSYAYHNYYGTFYDRHITHTNMGYDFKAILNGLDMEVGNPSSDLEMMKASLPDYIDSVTPFHAYYMTYSGHYQYNWDNEMSAKNRDKVDMLELSEEAKAYLACQLELEYALEYLINTLEKAGKADNTVIVLTSDHYPYGLRNATFDELAGEEVDRSFEKYRNSFICYIPGVNTVEINDYCSTIDILPTLLNIMGIEYDSRLLPGKDILSDAPHIAVLSDRSFITKDFRYNYETAEVIADKGITVSDKTLADYQNYVDNMFILSNAVLDTDYYAKIFERESYSNQKLNLNYEDFDSGSVYVEATVTFMVENGYMEPKSDRVFGVNDPGTVKEFAQVLYRMSDTSSEYDSYRDWALHTRLAPPKYLDSEDTITYGQIAEIIYNYVQYNEDTLPEDITEIVQEYPDIDPDVLAALKWCNENKIINGSVNERVYDSANRPLTRYQIAAFAQRLYMYGMIK